MPGINVFPWSISFHGPAASVVLVFCTACVGDMAGQTRPPEPCKDTIMNRGSSTVAAATPNPQPRHILVSFPTTTFHLVFLHMCRSAPKTNSRSRARTLWTPAQLRLQR